jgi:hypothetical protein
MASSLCAALIADGKSAMPSPRDVVLRLVQKLDRVPPVANTLHVSERGYRHIRAGQPRLEYTSRAATERGNAQISSDEAPT